MGNGEMAERYPGAVHVVISLAKPEKPDVRGYTIRQGEIAPVPLQSVPEAISAD